MNKTVRTGLSAFVFLVSSLSTFFLLSRCGSGDGSESSSDYMHSYSGSYDAPSAAANLLDTTVKFTLSWNETNGEISGEYTDDHFSSLPATVSGSVGADGIRTMTITLEDAVDGVTVFLIATDKAAGELSDTFNIASLQAKGPGGAVVFEKAGISITAIKTTGPTTATTTTTTPTLPGDVGIFFSEIAGNYDYFAESPDGKENGVVWTHGKKYKINVGVDGKVTIATDGEAKALSYGANTVDSYEKYDHEDYAILNPDAGVQIFAQRTAADKKVFFHYNKAGGANWYFKEADPGALKTKMDSLGVGYAVGTIKGKITNLTEGATEFKMNDPVDVTIDGSGKVTGTFGEFDYVDDQSYIQNSTKDGKQGATIFYYRPDNTTYPQVQFEVNFFDGKFTSIKFAKKTSASDVGIQYFSSAPK